MAQTIGKAFKISKKDVKSYGYASPNRGGGNRFARNGGVTAIAAVNGRGSYARSRGKSARAAMNGLSRDERLARARKITGADRAAFGRRMASASKGKTKMRTNATASQIAAARRNIKKAIASRRAGGHRANAWPGESRRHSHAAIRGWRSPSPYPSTRGTSAKRRREPPTTPRKKHKANSRRKKNMRTHRRNFSAKQRAAALRNLRKARTARRHAANPRRSKARRNGARRTTKRTHKRNARRTHRRNFSAKQRAAALRNLRKARAAQHRPNRRGKKRSHRRNAKRRTHRRNGMMANTKRRTKRSHRRNAKRRTHRRNFTAKQRAAALRNLRKARAAQHRPNRRGKKRSHRRNARRSHRRNGMMSNRRTKRSHRRNSHRRLRMNGKAFRRNEFLATAKAVLKIGAITTAGFVGHKALTKVFTEQVLDRILGAAAPAPAPAAAPAPTSGIADTLRPYRSVIGGAVVAALGVYAANRFVKDTQTKMFLTAGIATSLVHSVAVMALNKMAPQYAGYLSGHDATAVNIAAMYGLGAGASIMPEYHPIGEYFAQNGLGEYFAQNGLGEYFAQNGLGEYFAQNGLGAYTGNPDLMQAAAGYGTVDNPNSNIVDPGGDLDRQLSIAEAAAGVGAVQPFEAAAGFGAVQPFEAAAGFGAVSVVPPTADTWIPGTSNGQLWAGTMSISHGQARNEMNSAGILETAGNQGVFG